MRCPWLLVLAACAGPDADGVCATVEGRLPLARAPGLDLLVVVDRTPSMAAHDPQVAIHARAWANVLSQIDGGLPDLHLAVLTSDLGGAGVAGCSFDGDGAASQRTAACGVDGSFLRSRSIGELGTREQNFAGDFADAAACLLELPRSTCPVSQPLAAVQRAAGTAHPGLDGFRRLGDAYLLFLILTDSDDCSLRAAAALSGVAGEAEVDARCAAAGDRLSAVDAIVADLSPGPAGWVIGSVVSGPAPRLAALEALLPERFTQVDLGTENWLDALVQFPSPFPGFANPCVEGDIDLDPYAPGLQVNCVGRLVDPAPGGTSGGLPWCEDVTAGASCMELVEQSRSCGDKPLLQVRHGGLGADVSVDTYVELRCQQACG